MLKKYVPGIISTHCYACFTLTPVEYQKKTNDFPGLGDVYTWNLWGPGCVSASMVELAGRGSVFNGDIRIGNKLLH